MLERQAPPREGGNPWVPSPGAPGQIHMSEPVTGLFPGGSFTYYL